eukprot:scaffold106540_cov33-Tisochrysis_lutea.AAC.2
MTLSRSSQSPVPTTCGATKMDGEPCHASPTHAAVGALLQHAPHAHTKHCVIGTIMMVSLIDL